MSHLSPSVESLIHALRCLPGIGPKSAQRIAFHLLQHARPQGHALGEALIASMQSVKHCQLCQNLTEAEHCRLCLDPKRQQNVLCIVGSPIDIAAIEQTQSYRGHYFVLMGHLSPLDGIGPEDIGIPTLLHRLETHPVDEIILATSLTAEGEATAHYITERLKNKPILISRIAHGVPIGGELEFLNQSTIAQALQARAHVHTESA